MLYSITSFMTSHTYWYMGIVMYFTLAIWKENETSYLLLKEFLGKNTVFKLTHVSDVFGKGFGFSRIYTWKSGTIFRETMNEMSILSLNYLLYYLLYVVMNYCWLLVLDLTFVPTRHYFQPNVRFVTYWVHGVGCTHTTLVHLACRCWLLMLLWSTGAGIEDVLAFWL